MVKEKGRGKVCPKNQGGQDWRGRTALFNSMKKEGSGGGRINNTLSPLALPWARVMKVGLGFLTERGKRLEKETRPALTSRKIASGELAAVA